MGAVDDTIEKDVENEQRLRLFNNEIELFRQALERHHIDKGLAQRLITYLKYVFFKANEKNESSLQKSIIVDVSYLIDYIEHKDNIQSIISLLDRTYWSSNAAKKIATFILLTLAATSIIISVIGTLLCIPFTPFAFPIYLWIVLILSSIYTMSHEEISEDKNRIIQDFIIKTTTSENYQKATNSYSLWKQVQSAVVDRGDHFNCEVVNYVKTGELVFPHSTPHDLLASM